MLDLYKQYNLSPYKVYSVTALYDIVVDLGLASMQRNSFTTDWLNRKMKQGSLILPERKKNERYQFTGKQIVGIVKAFVPGGSGHYDWREDNATDSGENEKGE